VNYCFDLHGRAAVNLHKIKNNTLLKTRNKNAEVQLLAAIQNYTSSTKIIKTTCVSKIINTCHDPKQQNNIKFHLVCKFTRMITSHISQKRKEKRKEKERKRKIFTT